ncbi:hypothetical protein [Brevibacterium linens]|uniref:hypothetical protein n=1 Tax=Brevibacterium linens TaxID=1703 RepID=UPI003F887320
MTQFGRLIGAVRVEIELAETVDFHCDSSELVPKVIASDELSRLCEGVDLRDHSGDSEAMELDRTDRLGWRFIFGAREINGQEGSSASALPFHQQIGDVCPAHLSRTECLRDERDGNLERTVQSNVSQSPGQNSDRIGERG